MRGPASRLAWVVPRCTLLSFREIALVRCAGCRGFAFTPAVVGRLAEIQQRHAAIASVLSSGSAPPATLVRLGREAAELERVVAAIAEHDSAAAEVTSLDELAKEVATSEPEIARMARDERIAAAEVLASREERLLQLLVPADDADRRDAILEVRAGTGGEEAALFAGDLLRMYEGYARLRSWRWAVMSLHTSEATDGGVREASVAVSAGAEPLGAYGVLRHESGVHRVQRVPETETAGRVHTSTASVAVLPEADEVDVELRASDVRVDTYRAQGAGGQHVNTTDSAVRLTHIPTGLVVTIQDERSQIQNRAKAMRVLRARLFERERDAAEQARATARRAQIGRAERSERVRTYNFAQNRVTDHRVAVTVHNVASMLRGEQLDAFISALDADAKATALATLLDEPPPSRDGPRFTT